MLPIRAAEFLCLHALETHLERLLVHEQRAPGLGGKPGCGVRRLGVPFLPAGMAEVDAGSAQLQQVLLLRIDETEFSNASSSLLDLCHERPAPPRCIDARVSVVIFAPAIFALV